MPKRTDFCESYDVGLYGLWYGRNYGSILTYYALNKTIRDMGYSVAMLENPLSGNNDANRTFPEDHPFYFSRRFYEITPHATLDNMDMMNSYCKAFIVGSDQLWNYALSKRYGQSYFLDFADDNHAKLSYATSFGHTIYNGPDDDKELVRHNLSRFDKISVRDGFSKTIIEQEFGLKAERVLDSVFLCGADEYRFLANESTFTFEKRYIFAYILNPNDEIGDQLKRISHENGMDIIVAFDEAGDASEHAMQLGVDDSHIELCNHLSVYDWLARFYNADYVVTDSFHGICFSLIFRKNFVALQNNKRGPDRFTDIMQLFGIEERLVKRETELSQKFEEALKNIPKMDNASFNAEYEKLQKRSYCWLDKALEECVQI